MYSQFCEDFFFKVAFFITQFRHSIMLVVIENSGSSLIYSKINPKFHFSMDYRIYIAYFLFLSEICSCFKKETIISIVSYLSLIKGKFSNNFMY
jgi:hypothetical protein